MMICIIAASPLYLCAQQKTPYPKIGDTFENYTFTDIVNYSKARVSTDEFRGKWLVLDFWAITCGGCLNSFPKMNKISHTFGDKVQLIMIGAHDGKKDSRTSEAKTKRLYELYKKKLGLSFTVAFDSTLYDQIHVYALPHILVIDPKGIVQAKTYSLDSAQLRQIIEGKKPNLEYAYSIGEGKLKEFAYDKNLPLLSSGKFINGGNDTDFIARSLLKRWVAGLPEYNYFGFRNRADRVPGWGETYGLDIPSMLRVAYFGQESWDANSAFFGVLNKNIILENIDSALFEPKKLLTGENMYCYSLKVEPKKGNIEFMRHLFQEDLQRYFGFKSKVELRKVKVWKLVVIDKQRVAQLKTTGQKQEIKSFGPYEGYNYTNVSIDQIIKGRDVCQSPFKDMYKNLDLIPPLINDTGLSFNVDMSIKAFMTDFQDVKDAFNRNGFDLVLSEKELNSIVISNN
ncbi:Redoxin domain protein [Mucilaginibacter paludis DSM 18603]|uniref:Redoxin domain protein n=2 Tax=Mucilaginibacter TaxID=423349 RepID=H1YBV2_9SPHI|nr:Redoxin domain protein [Mucilaginibacter paludis DSM 18603]